MGIENFELMNAKYPTLCKLLLDIAVNAGKFEGDRIEETIDEFVAQSSGKHTQEAIESLVQMIEEPLLSHDDLGDLMNYELESNEEAQQVMLAMLDRLQKQFAAKARQR